MKTLNILLVALLIVMGGIVGFNIGMAQPIDPTHTKIYQIGEFRIYDYAGSNNIKIRALGGDATIWISPEYMRSLGDNVQVNCK